MNLEDETLLSAYLDDELDAPRRIEVEAALRSNPRLNQTLRDLSATRDLVAGLRRPAAPADLSAEILSRLAPRQQAGPRRLVSAARRLPGPFLMGAGVSLAAGVVIAVSLAMPGLHRPAPTRGGLDEGGLARLATPKDRRAVELTKEPGPVSRDQGPEGSVKLGGLGREALERGNRDEGAPPASPLAPAADEAPKIRRREAGPVALADSTARKKDALARSKAEGAALDADSDRELGEEGEARGELLAMLDRPGVRRMMIVADVIDPQVIEAFDDVVTNARLKHPLQGRVEIGQGVILDPDEPEGRAVIFAMSMDQAERVGLLEALKEKFPRALVREDTSTPPDVTTHLAGEVGKFKVFRGEAAAGLMANQLRPSDMLALKMAPNHGIDGIAAGNAPAPRPAESRAIDPAREARAKANSEVGPDFNTPAVTASPAAKPSEIEAKRQSLLRAEVGKRGVHPLNEPATRAEGPSPSGEDGLVAQNRAREPVYGRRTPEPETVLVWLTDRRRPR